MPTCALVAACDFNAKDFERRYAAGNFDCVIAVDAGLAHLRGIGCVADVIIGDFDSLGFVPEDGTVIRHPSKKDKSDLELALDYAQERLYSEAVVYGTLGGRIDHTVAAMQLCARFAEGGMDVALIGADVALRILVGPAEYDVPPLGRGTVSVFSATDASRGVTERGMEYSLDNVVLSNRTSRGLSNELIGRRATVSVAEGTLYVFHPVAV